jgi:hypothetical protein
MRPLPWLASVALATRCAELLAPSIGDFWQNAPETERTLVRAAIRGALQTAETGRAPDTLPAHADAITRLVGRFVLHLHGMPVEETELPQALASLPDTQIRIIRSVIDPAAREARAATATNADNAFDECRDGVSWAYSLAEDLDDSDLTNELNRSVNSLYELCDREHIGDNCRFHWTGSRWCST